MKDFFKTIGPIAEQTELTLTIKGKGGLISVMLIPKANVKDAAAGHIKPICVTGTLEELDEGFLDHIIGPLQKTAGILSNIADFEQGTQRLASENSAAKAAQDAEAKRLADRKKKLQDLTIQADKFAGDKQYQKAVDALNTIVTEDLSDNLQQVKTRISDLKGKMMEGTIFSMAAPPPVPDALVPQPAEQVDSEPIADESPEPDDDDELTQAEEIEQEENLNE